VAKNNRKFERNKPYCKAYAMANKRIKNKIRRMKRTLKTQPNNEALNSAIKSLEQRGAAAWHRPRSKYSVNK
jgi:CHASE3 domain sensor protein